MALGNRVENSLIEAESHLRNALSYAARGERPVVCKQIADMITNIDSIMSFDELMDTMEGIPNEKNNQEN